MSVFLIFMFFKVLNLPWMQVAFIDVLNPPQSK
jgi:hypothetical protein